MPTHKAHLFTDPRPTILVVDDCPAEVAELIDQLRVNNYTVLTAEDGAHGLALAIEHAPSLVLLDILLPNLSGVQVCQTLTRTATTVSIPVIFLSHSSDSTSKMEGFKAGCVDYITKPFHIQETLARIKVHLELSTRNAPRQQDRYSQVVARALSLFTGKNGHTLTTTDVAKEIGVSESTLRRRFVQEFDMSLMNYVRELRFDWAKHMLKTSQFRISDIAYDIGYSSAGDFSTAFRKRFGITPREYREEK